MYTGMTCNCGQTQVSEQFTEAGKGIGSFTVFFMSSRMGSYVCQATGKAQGYIVDKLYGNDFAISVVMSSTSMKYQVR